MSLEISDHPLPIVGRARIYVCGITPYDTTHLGHAATFVWTDIAVRVLEASGLRVDLCRNITDVDDDIIAQAAQRGVDYRALGTEQTYRFQKDMEALGVTRPIYEPRSRDYIEEVVALAQGLLEKDRAYQRNGSIYFKGENILSYLGKLSREEAIVLARKHGGRPDDPEKDDPLDVPLWQATPCTDPLDAPEPSWSSPWGEGRPGWHAECSAMSMTLLGNSIDIHAGGSDLKFPHHAYETAQCEALTGVTPFARAWLHIASVCYKGEKMSKSLGNLLYVKDLTQRWRPTAIRLLLADRAWDEAWEVDLSHLDEAENRLENLWKAAGRSKNSEVALAAALQALMQNLNVPKALNIAEEAGGQTMRHIGNLLGIL